MSQRLEKKKKKNPPQTNAGLAFTLEKGWSCKQNDVLPLASALLRCYKKLFISLNTTPTLLYEIMQQCHVIAFLYFFLALGMVTVVSWSLHHFETFRAEMSQQWTFMVPIG